MSADKVGKTVKVKKDVVSQYEGKEGIVSLLIEDTHYRYTVAFPNGDRLAFAEDELIFPRSTK